MKFPFFTKEKLNMEQKKIVEINSWLKTADYRLMSNNFKQDVKQFEQAFNQNKREGKISHEVYQHFKKLEGSVVEVQLHLLLQNTPFS